MALPDISSQDIIMSQQEAHSALDYLLLGQVSLSANQLTLEDRLLAQKLTIHAIDKHYEMGFIQALFSSTAKIPRGPTAVMKSFLSKAAKHWFKHASQDELQEFIREPKLFRSVVNTIASRFRSVWMIREQTGMLIY